MGARCVMVLGTSSHAGKSWLATALCRWYARQGLRVAPFKAQNMSNNARVAVGGEIGSAQYFQALAACAVPEVRMNPLLLKPERDTASQVVCLGQVDQALTRMPWRERSAVVWPRVAQAFDELAAEHDLIVLEGAGSPAEINLRESDFVNMRMAQHAQARCLLVSDIDRGGAFAHLYGTWALLNAAERSLLHGFVLNKFRGDAALLEPGPEQLRQLTGIRTVATLPMWRDHGLPEEDGLLDAPPHSSSAAAQATTRTVAVLAYPRISNLDEFQPLERVPGLRLRWVRSAAALADLGPADWIVLPGSKHTGGDLAWLRARGLDAAICGHAQRGGAVLGVCGGLQMLGAQLSDPHGVDGAHTGVTAGLGLLSLRTEFEREKIVRHQSLHFAQLNGAWAALSACPARGYEIHHGRTQALEPAAGAGGACTPVLPQGLGWQNARGNVLGVYLHGLFESPAVLHALFGASVPTLDTLFNGLADFVDAHFAPGVLASLADPSQREALP